MTYIKNFICAILLVASLSLGVFASEEQKYIYYYPEYDITIEFSKNSNINTDTQIIIAESIVHNANIPQTYSLCWLTGHDSSVETVSAISHKVANSEPRCQRTVYNVTTCAKCDYTDIVLVGSNYIYCCPVE